MIHSRKAVLRFSVLLLCGLAGPMGVHAAPAEREDTGTVYTLTPEEKAAIEAESDERARLGLSGLGEEGERRIRGEASVMVGTGGARGLATSIIAPVGKSATVGASFLYERNMYRYHPYYGYGHGYGYDRYPYDYRRGSFGASDHFGHLDRVERMERYPGW